jgi:hypothetical protein
MSCERDRAIVAGYREVGVPADVAYTLGGFRFIGIKPIRSMIISETNRVGHKEREDFAVASVGEST